MAAHRVKRRGKRRPSPRDPDEDELSPVDEFLVAGPGDDDLAADLRRMQLETGSAVYAGRRGLF